MATAKTKTRTGRTPAPDVDSVNGRPLPKRKPHEIRVPLEDGKTREEMLTELAVKPYSRHAVLISGLAGESFTGERPDQQHASKMVATVCGEVRAGNLDSLTDMLAAQAMTLDTMFSEFTRRAMKNMGHYPDAVERYAGLATKAQSNCRLTLETLAKVKRGGKQTIQITHVHEGGQAIVADTVNNTGGRRGADGEEEEQSHEQPADAPVAALPGPHPERNGVPLPSSERQESVPAARRPRRSTEG